MGGMGGLGGMGGMGGGMDGMPDFAMDGSDDEDLPDLDEPLDDADDDEVVADGEKANLANGDAPAAAANVNSEEGVEVDDDKTEDTAH